MINDLRDQNAKCREFFVFNKKKKGFLDGSISSSKRESKMFVRGIVRVFIFTNR